MRNSRLASLALSVAVLAPAPVRAQWTHVFDFDPAPSVLVTPFTDVDGDRMARFTSPDGAVFSVVDEFQQTTLGWQGLSGNVLLDADAPMHVLNAEFFLPVSAVRLNFALNAPAGETHTLTLRGFSGPTLVGSIVEGGVPVVGFGGPEGVITFIPTIPQTITRIELTSTAPNFAIDNVRIVSAVPEPTTMGLMATGVALLGLGASRRRRPS